MRFTRRGFLAFPAVLGGLVPSLSRIDAARKAALAAAAAVPPGQTVVIHLSNEALFTRADVDDLIRQINEHARDGGKLRIIE